MRREAQRGFSAPTYAYSRNNPIRYTDPTGLCVSTYDCCLERNPANPAACGGFKGPKPIELPEFDPRSLTKPVRQLVEDVCTVVSMATSASLRRKCDQLMEVDNDACKELTGDSQRVARCYASMMARHAACLAKQPLPPLDRY